jgi:hypothetical protein
LSFFCLLWVPLFYFLRRIIAGAGASSGSIWALLLGSVVAITQFFLGYFVSPGGFELSRWIFGFVDIVTVPVLVPLLIYLIIFILKGFSGEADFARFALLWLIPWGAMRALTWSALNDPILLVVVPLLWTALAVGVSFFINWMITKFKWYSALVSIPCILVLPVLAASAYWAFFSQQTLMGFAMLLIAYIPVIISFIFERHKN